MLLVCGVEESKFKSFLFVLVLMNVYHFGAPHFTSIVLSMYLQCFCIYTNDERKKMRKKKFEMIVKFYKSCKKIIISTASTTTVTWNCIDYTHYIHKCIYNINMMQRQKCRFVDRNLLGLKLRVQNYRQNNAKSIFHSVVHRIHNYFFYFCLFGKRHIEKWKIPHHIVDIFPYREKNRTKNVNRKTSLDVNLHYASVCY